MFLAGLDRELVDALHAYHHEGRRGLKKFVGGIHGDRWAGIPSMQSWTMDDVTSNLQCAFTNPDGSVSLIAAQIGAKAITLPAITPTTLLAIEKAEANRA